MPDPRTDRLIALVFGDEARMVELEALGVRTVENRVSTLESGGDTVARADIEEHLRAHLSGGGNGSVPEHRHQPGWVQP